MGITNEEREKHIRIANMLIGAINDLIRPILMYQIEKDVTREALENYIKMLEQQPSEDCISRAELKKWLDMNFSFGGAMKKLELFDRLDKELPSVTPSRPKGKWIYDNCSICGYGVKPWNNTPYCPNCGSDMGGDKNEME